MIGWSQVPKVVATGYALILSAFAIFQLNSGPTIDGTWTCFRSAASGTCGGATAHYFDAVCNGVANDSPNLGAWTAYGVALNPAVVKLYIPPGSVCNFSATPNTITWDSQGSGSGINNVIIYAYGASADIIDAGGSAFHQDSTHSATINTVSAGATSVVVNDGNVSRFAATDWIYITGVCLDTNGGYPPTFQFYEKRLITSVVGTIVSFADPLVYDYKSTWPVCTMGNMMGTAGPATIFKIPQNWNTDLALYGLTVTNGTGAQINFINRVTLVKDVTVVNGTTSPSAVNTFTSIDSHFPVGMEIDKVSETMTFIRGTSGQTGAQTSSPKNLIYDGVAITCSINGSPLNMTVNNSTVTAGGCDGRVSPGPTFFGHGSSFTITNSTFPVAAMSQFGLSEAATAAMSYSAGTFTMPKSSGSGPIGSFFQALVPNNVGQTFTYKFGYHNSFQNACTPLTTFQISDLREDGSNYYADTLNWKQSGSPISTPSSLPSLMCADTIQIINYPAETITQTNTGASPDLTQFAPP